MKQVTLRKLESHSWAIAVGDKRRGARYEVLVGGQRIGEVEKCSEPSRQWGSCAFSVYWRARNLAGETVGFRHYTMGAAVNALLEERGA